MSKKDTVSGGAATTPASEKLKPSQYMRGLRPEYYSDTQNRDAYELDQSTLEYHLDTLTDRNETHDFEIFVRKLCERAICPNLRPQTGPEGGGDGKADTETFPVAPEISIIYVGDVAGGTEKWAFAFSAKKRWKEKVRKDVEGIVGTERPYDKIISVTSQFARAKDRAALEQELSEDFGVPVTIHDRSWIVKEVIENDRKDIAFNYLGIGKAVADPHRLGPTDYSRAQHLAEIEKALADPEAFRGMESQRVSEALVAAKLSRGLEKPRVEIDGQFARAIRLADAEGNYRQRLEARYEQIWTGFWWFDDCAQLNASYSSFEKEALKSDHSANVSLLCNLHQLLINSVVHGHMTPEECDFDTRTATLKQALHKIASNTERPNNALEAETSLLIIKMNEVVVEAKPEEFQEVWRGFIQVLDRAVGLGEFKAERLEQMIEIGGNLAGNDPVYNELVEKLADFVGKRSSEAKGAIILLKRAKQLDFSDRIEMIRLLGKATYALSKKEYANELIDATQHLAVAYRSAGLLWAARAACLMALATIVVEGEGDNQLPVSFVPTLKLWAWLSISLRHIPDTLNALQLLNGALRGLPLTEDTKERVEDDIRELEYALGCVFLNLSDSELQKLENVPDILEALGLFMARAALLYTLGYGDILRADQSIPKTETEERIHETFSVLASQPLAEETKGVLIVNGENEQRLQTSILGMTVEVVFIGTDTFLVVAQTLLGSLEAFFSTSIEQKVIAHTERFKIALVEGKEASKPTIETKSLDMEAIVTWPTGLPVANYERHGEIRKFFAEVSAHILVTTMIVDDIAELLDRLHDDEATHYRTAMIAAAPNSYHRVMSCNASRLSDWKEIIRRSYPLKLPRPQLDHIDLPTGADEDEDGNDLVPPKSHRDMRVQTVVNVHAWDAAEWKATGFAEYRGRPAIAFAFRNAEAGKSIFKQWRERIGFDDANDEIYLSIIRKLPDQESQNYILMVTSKLGADSNIKQSIILGSRSMTMTPPDNTNLNRFLATFEATKEFYLMPAGLTAGGQPVMFHEIAILKRTLSVRDAKDIGPDDVERMALQLRSLTD